jgi:hypothetical protein
MKTPRELEPLAPTLRVVQRLIDRFEKRGIIIGGAAMCLLGQPRTTADVDALLLVSIDDLSRLLRAAREVGLVPRTRDVDAFARRNRIVLLRHRADDTDVDVSLGALPLEVEAVQRSRIIRAGNLRLRVPTVEDLIIMKAVAHRPKDMLDIHTLVEMHPDLDRKRIKQWVRQFAVLLGMPELWTDVDTILRVR